MGGGPFPSLAGVKQGDQVVVLAAVVQLLKGVGRVVPGDALALRLQGRCSFQPCRRPDGQKDRIP